MRDASGKRSTGLTWPGNGRLIDVLMSEKQDVILTGPPATPARPVRTQPSLQPDDTTSGWIMHHFVATRPDLRPPSDRQDQGENRTAPGRAFDFDIALVALHDAVDRGQTQAHAVAFPLGRVERFENMGQVLGIDARPESWTRISIRLASARNRALRASRPPSGMASLALRMRLMTHCWS